MIKHLAINKFCKTLLQESEADLEERKRYQKCHAEELQIKSESFKIRCIS